MIREMNVKDWEQVAEIYLQGIENGVSTFNTKCPSYEEWDNEYIDNCRFVYIDGEKVVGWVAISPTSSSCVYKGCVEMSIYIDNDYQGRGIGTELVDRLLCEAKKQGYRSILSTVISIDSASVELHKKCGFREVGYREKIAKDRFGNWQNTILFELRLESKVEKSANYFKNGFNCSQAVFATFAGDFGLSEEMALKVATQFGGGARKGEMCGAVSGALMVLGLKFGHYNYNAPEEKRNAYKIAEEFMNRFIEKNGTVVCRELLGYDVSKQEDMLKIKELGLFKSICPKMIQCATEIVEQMLQE
ncbi:MAG: C-GCAxxG-C-C family (seleno)protein [Acutalibacteraceae bacterium]